MNGKVSKRIRWAARASGKSVKQLKREYLALPYHRRKLAGIVVKPHEAAIERFRWVFGGDSF